MNPSDGSTDPTLTPDQLGALSDTAVAGDTLPEAVESSERAAPAGYQLGELLGRGGMGEVMLAEDLRIGRKVAVKRMRSAAPTPDAVARFLREAKIQARLDHPAIVPVHELGHDAAGRPFFTMKRLAGVTLAEVLADEHATLQKLLRAFVDVCLAIDFAHARNVIHRDLKPANVMLGDYGEVYVLDWGVARVLEEHEPAATDIESTDGQTQVGSVLGTPGYMSPEQVRGEPVGPATDIYALGSILFEILAGEPAHPRGQAAFVTTLSGTAISPATRTPDRPVPPELDATCIAALAEASVDRPTARVLADRIQRYLDGDRDLERRRVLAAEQLALAEAAVASGDPARRADAMREAGRALALDPESTGAAALVTKLMLEPPAQLPGPLEERLLESDRELVAKQAWLAGRALAGYFVMIPFMLWMGVRDWLVVGGTLALVATAIGGSLIMARRRSFPIGWALLTNAIMLVLLSRYIGSFVLLPALVVSSAVSLVVFPTLIERPWIVIATFVGAFLVPLGLEATGIWSSTWEVVDGHLVVSSTTLELDPTATGVFLVAATVATIIVLALVVNAVGASQRAGRRQLEVYAWHLDQLLPVQPPRPAPSPSVGCAA